MTATLERRQIKKFDAGKKRYVCVNRMAIVANLTEKRNFPTVIVVEDGKHYEFHECKVEGTLQFDDTRNDLPAKVFIETQGDIIAYTDPSEPTFIDQPKRPSIVTRFFSRLNYGMRSVPVVGCFYEMATGQDGSFAEPPPVKEQVKVKVQPKPLEKPRPRPEPAPYYGCR